MKKQYILYIFDRDGSLVLPRSGKKFPENANDWAWIPGRLETVQALVVDQGKKTAYATNQGGIAFGYMREDEMLQELLRFGNEGGFDAGRVCFSHPDAIIERYKVPCNVRKDITNGHAAPDTRRKPGPGMLLEIMQELNVSPDETVFIGDREEDEQAARNAGVDFVHADEFFATIAP